MKQNPNADNNCTLTSAADRKVSEAILHTSSHQASYSKAKTS